MTGASTSDACPRPLGSSAVRSRTQTPLPGAQSSGTRQKGPFHAHVEKSWGRPHCKVLACLAWAIAVAGGRSWGEWQLPCLESGEDNTPPKSRVALTCSLGDLRAWSSHSHLLLLNDPVLLLTCLVHGFALFHPLRALSWTKPLAGPGDVPPSGIRCSFL